MKLLRELPIGPLVMLMFLAWAIAAYLEPVDCREEAVGFGGVRCEARK